MSMSGLSRGISFTGLFFTSSVFAQSPGPEAITLEPVLVEGVEYPQIGVLGPITSVDLSDARWLAVLAKATPSAGGPLHDVVLVGPSADQLAVAASGGGRLRGTNFNLTLEDAAKLQIGRYGDISFTGRLTSASGRTEISYVWAPGPAARFTVIARADSSATARIGAFNSTTHNERGVLTCLGTMTGPFVTFETDKVIYSGRAPAISMVREGLASINGHRLNFFDAASMPTPFGSGFACVGVTTDPNDQNSSRFGLFEGVPLSPIVRSQDPVPGLEGARYSSFPSSPSIDRHGHLMFLAQTDGGQLLIANNQLVIRQGDHAPGLPPGVTIRLMTPPIAYGYETGAVFTSDMFGSDIAPANSSAMFAGRLGAIERIVRQGDPAPGAIGAAIGRFGPNETIPIYVNTAGVVLFRTKLTGPPVTEADDMALYAWDEDDGLRLVAREGTTIEINGAPRTIADLRVDPRSLNYLFSESSGFDGRPTILNRYGECYFVARFTDGGSALLRAQVARRPCTADYNLDRFIDCFDYLAFVEAFEAGDMEADINLDAFLDFFDYAEYIDAFKDGC